MTKTSLDVAEPPIGRREANKRDKLARIRQAARDTFHAEGYEAAMVRDIAAAAGVGLGTLFLYAKKKQDLLLLIFEEDFIRLSKIGVRHIDAADPLVDQIIDFFRGFFEFFASTPSLSRDMLREITFSTSGIVAARIWAGVRSTEHHMLRLVARMQLENRIDPEIDTVLAAHLIFGIYRIELRACVDSERPDVDASLERFRQELNLLMRGLEIGPPAGAPRPAAPPRVGRRRPSK